MTCDPDELAALAKCFECLNGDMADAVLTYLLVQWALAS